MARVLIVEDNLEILELITYCLSSENHLLETLSDGKQALERLSNENFDAVILDWELPGFSGIEILKQFRAAGGGTRIMMLANKPNLSEKMESLESGADDYVTKPFHPDELSARLRALLRRPAEFVGTILSSGNVSLDPLTGVVKKSGVPVQLTAKERALLEFLMRHPKEVFSAEAILDHVWPTQSESSPLAVRVCINGLRSKLDSNSSSSIIENVHGVGYRLRSEAASSSSSSSS